MYRQRQTISKKMAAMRAAKECARMESTAPDYPPMLDLPSLRRRITIEDFDFGHVTHTIELYQADRIDCYRALADGRPWKDRIGWTKVLEGIRKSFLRVHSHG